MKKRFFPGQWPGHYWLIALYCLLFIPLFRPVVSTIDPAGYYAWARSVLIDGDLDVRNEFADLNMPPGAPTTPTGYLHNQWSAGSALIWLPGMAVVHGGLLLGQELGLTIPADGYSWPYPLAAAFISTVTGLLALWLSYRLARELFGEFAALLATLTVWLATPFVFFQYHQPLMSHAHDACANALFLTLWWRTRREPENRWLWFFMGLVIGVAVWIRPQNGILLLAVGAIWLWEEHRGRREDTEGHRGWEKGFLRVTTHEVDVSGKRKRGVGLRRRILAQLFPLAIGVLLPIVPLLFFWHEVYGAWIVNTYTASGGGTFDFTAPHLLEVLFSSDRGLFTWAPVTLLCLVGLRWVWARHSRLGGLMGILVLAHWYVISCWSFWAGGDSPGPRFWLSLTPIFVLGLAALVEQMKMVSRPLLTLVGTAFIVWNLLLLLQYSLGLVAPTGEIDLWLMVKNQFAVIPQIFSRVAERLAH
jgi:hypothetical protein